MWSRGSKYTLSTSGHQFIVGPGRLVKDAWQERLVSASDELPSFKVDLCAAIVADSVSDIASRGCVKCCAYCRISPEGSALCYGKLAG